MNRLEKMYYECTEPKTNQREQKQVIEENFKKKPPVFVTNIFREDFASIKEKRMP